MLANGLIYVLRNNNKEVFSVSPDCDHTKPLCKIPVCIVITYFDYYIIFLLIFMSFLLQFFFSFMMINIATVSIILQINSYTILLNHIIFRYSSSFLLITTIIMSYYKLLYYHSYYYYYYLYYSYLS